MIDPEVELSLNPCFSGTYSRRVTYACNTYRVISLNPCFSGTYSRRMRSQQGSNKGATVLILVLVEHTLGATN